MQTHLVTAEAPPRGVFFMGNSTERVNDNRAVELGQLEKNISLVSPSSVPS